MSDALFPRAFDGIDGSGRFAPLRVLAGLVNDLLAGMDTPRSADPLYAVGAIDTIGSIDTAEQAAIEATPTQRAPRVSGRSVRGPRPSPTPDPSPSGHGAATPPEAEQPSAQEIEQSHAETWKLVRLAQAGDGEAFGALYDRYVDAVFRFIYFRVNDRALAEDFTSETFLRALRRIGSISYQGRDIGAWFITIARNIVLDHMKSARHRLEITTADTIESRETIASTESAVLETLQSERLMKAVGELGAEQRECVMLRFVHGLSVSETAAVMGKNDGAIKALQHRAVRKLADLVGNELR